MILLSFSPSQKWWKTWMYLPGWCGASDTAVWAGEVGPPTGGNWMHWRGDDGLCCITGIGDGEQISIHHTHEQWSI